MRRSAKPSKPFFDWVLYNTTNTTNCMHGVLLISRFFLVGTALLLWVPAVGGFDLVLDGLVGWTMEYVSYMVGAASRIKPFHADDDTLALRALIFLDPFTFDTPHAALFLFCVLAPRFSPSRLGKSFSFSHLPGGMWEALGRLAYLNATLAYVGLWMKLSKEERKWTD